MSTYTLVSVLGTNPSTGKINVTVTNITTINGITTTSPTYTYTSEGFTNKDGSKLPSISSDIIVGKAPFGISTDLYSNIVTSGPDEHLESTFILGSGAVVTNGPYFKCDYSLDASTASTPILVTGNYIDDLGNNVPLIQNKIYYGSTGTNKSTIYTIVDKDNSSLGNVIYNPTLEQRVF